MSADDAGAPEAPEALENQCSFQPEKWDEWPGIDGWVMICNTHGYPGWGMVYDFAIGEPVVGVCQGEPHPDDVRPAPPADTVSNFETTTSAGGADS